ncbi:FAA hydrolase family protein [Parashewanella spongiae]|uniref:FAA hydrolase family protein n=1 Tax=Parashewanella spongiae TaxID=342950 RepID=A0A3A6UHE3_9GAMM|nr:fumarylacetoacetate hydrolase family protein [Parashewanella spongiae]MCL1077946.1 fumarylacetoacetate hydrolase family protein [Parashewanella spongiae]RJY18434.1 FAA hydrolase family protein [Parashewanella spongiae]
MKLLRYGIKGQEKPAIIDDNGDLRCLSAIISDVNGTVLADKKTMLKLRSLDLTTLALIQSPDRIGACIADVGKFICIGLNYADHAAESGMPIPQEPEVFSKFTSSISGPNDNIIMPRNSHKLDWEVELAIVIGRKASYVSTDEAESYIAGYCVCNDVSERNFQLERGSQWDKGKGCDSFGPLGPYLVTKDEVSDPTKLKMWLEVNGKRYQNGSTNTMIFQPATIVSYLSQFTTLEPGDVISTGTPPGVGLGQQPPIYLEQGDVIELGIESLGTQKQTVVSPK